MPGNVLWLWLAAAGLFLVLGFPAEELWVPTPGGTARSEILDLFMIIL